MSFKGILKGIGKAFIAVAPVAVNVAAAVVPGGGIAAKILTSPLMGSVINAIGSARLQGGTGEQQFEAALQSLLVAGPSLIHEIETTFGIDIPDESFEPYLRGMIQLHYDLLRASGKIASAKAINTAA